MKENNEITVKIKCEINEFYKILEQKGFKVIDKFSLIDTFFIPKTLKIEKMATREILSKALLIRNINRRYIGKITKCITYKIKKIDENGNILNQKSINCIIEDINEAEKLLKAIGYRKILKIKENDRVYEKDGLQLAIKDIKDGDKLIEIETEENEELNTIEKLIQKVKEIEIPIYTDSYFVKKAEIELDKVLKKEK